MWSSLMVSFLIVTGAAGATAQLTALPYGKRQCGGIGYTGPTDCYDPYNESPEPTPVTQLSTTLTTTYTPVPTRTDCLQHWALCGGKNYIGPGCCIDEPEWFCEPENEYFSECHQRQTT